MLKGLRAGAWIACLSILCAGAYLGARGGVDAFWGGPPSQGPARSGITGIVDGPTPEAPVSPSAAVRKVVKDAADKADDGPATGTISAEPTGGDVQGALSGAGDAAGTVQGGGAQADPGPSPPPPAPDPAKEDPPIFRYPG
jgi:hypothetical protein